MSGIQESMWNVRFPPFPERLAGLTGDSHDAVSTGCEGCTVEVRGKSRKGRVSKFRSTEESRDVFVRENMCRCRVVGAGGGGSQLSENSRLLVPPATY